MNIMSSQELCQYIKDNSVKDKENKKYFTYAEMLIYNDLKTHKKITGGLDNLKQVYDKLFGFGLSLSGYQFIGLILEKSFFDDSTNEIYPFAYFMLAVGFIVSLFGSLLSFCMYQFLEFSKNESDEYIVKGIVKYRRNLSLPHHVLVVNTFCFAVPINILIHTNLKFVYGIIFNVISVILLGTGFPIHKKMITDNATFCKPIIEKEE